MIKKLSVHLPFIPLLEPLTLPAAKKIEPGFTPQSRLLIAGARVVGETAKETVFVTSELLRLAKADSSPRSCSPHPGKPLGVEGFSVL